MPHKFLAVYSNFDQITGQNAKAIDLILIFF